MAVRERGGDKLVHVNLHSRLAVALQNVKLGW